MGKGLGSSLGCPPGVALADLLGGPLGGGPLGLAGQVVSQGGVPNDMHKSVANVRVVSYDMGHMYMGHMTAGLG